MARIRQPLEDRIYSKIELVDDHWLWTGLAGPRGDRPYILVSVGGRSRQENVRAFLYRQTYGEVPAGHVVFSSCGQSKCVNPEHLVSRKGSAPALDHDMVAEIRSLLASGESQRAVARKFGVVQSTISSINCGLTWKR